LFPNAANQAKYVGGPGSNPPVVIVHNADHSDIAINRHVTAKSFPHIQISWEKNLLLLCDYGVTSGKGYQK